MGTTFNKIKLKDGSVRYFEDAEARTELAKKLEQKTTMPAAAADLVGKIYQYIGTTDGSYTNGYFYKVNATPVTPSYEAPNGQLYKYKTEFYASVGGTWKYTLWTNYRLCVSKESKEYNNNNYNLLSCFDYTSTADENALFQVGTYEGSHTIKVGGRIYGNTSSSNPIEDGYVLFGDSATPLYNWIINMTEAEVTSANIPVFDTNAEAYNYASTLENTYIWERADVQPVAPAQEQADWNQSDNTAVDYIKNKPEIQTIQLSTMPEASTSTAGKIYQYVGETDSNYTNGYFYRNEYSEFKYTGAKLMEAFNTALNKEYTNVSIFNDIITKWNEDRTLKCAFYQGGPNADDIMCILAPVITADDTYIYPTATWYRSSWITPTTQTISWQEITSDGSQQHHGIYSIFNSILYNDLKWNQLIVQPQQYITLGQMAGYTPGQCATAEGNNTIAFGDGSHAEGIHTVTGASCAHAEGYYSWALGESSHAEGYYTKASSNYQHVSGKYNEEDSSSTYVLIVGNGSNDADRSNALTLDWSGNLKATSYANFSSKKYKENISDMAEEEAKKILQLNPVKYDYKSDKLPNNQYGLIAEDVEPIMTYPIVYLNNEADSIDYSKFVPALIKMIQIQQKEIDELKNK